MEREVIVQSAFLHSIGQGNAHGQDRDQNEGRKGDRLFHLSHLQAEGGLAAMSAWSDNAPPHTWLEMPMAYGGDASALSCLAW
jgi:hypothetical protein